MIIKTENEKGVLREAGKRLAVVLNDVISIVKSGMMESELDQYALSLIEKWGDKPAFLNYKPNNTRKPYPATLCVSINNNVVHGIPKDYKIKDGDMVSLDLGLIHKGIIVDIAKTIIVGDGSDEEKRLIKVTKDALIKGIEASLAGGHIGDIGYAIETFVSDTGFSVVAELGGHGVGCRVHEEPFIPNIGKKGTGPEIVEGMVLALEPIISAGSPKIKTLHDGYTIQTKDGSKTAHFEHTILVNKDGPEIITII